MFYVIVNGEGKMCTYVYVNMFFVCVCVWQTTLTSKETSNLPGPPLKVDHEGTGNSQLHKGAPFLQAVGGPACRQFHTQKGWVKVTLSVACRGRQFSEMLVWSCSV